MKKIILTLLVFGTASILSTYSHAFSDKKPFDIAADSIEFIDASKEMIAEGHVVVIQGSSTLKADYLHYDRLQRRLIGKGNVILRENGGILNGQHLDYDLATETANLESPRAYAAPWFFQGGTWEKHEDYYVGRDGSFTSCELPDAHYYFRARRIHYVPNDRFWAWSTRMYVDGVPVMYMPFAEKPLGPQRATFQATPGNDSANGAFAKTVTTLRYSDEVYQKVLYDYYSNVGNGFGTELDYHPDNNMKGSLFGYYIKPQEAPDVSGAPSEAQYNIRSYHWERINATTTLQSNVNLRKNVSFDTLFYHQDDNQAVSDINNSIALTKQTKTFNQRLVIEADQGIDPNEDPVFGDLHVQTASLPRYEYTMYQKELWAPAKPLAPLRPGHLIGPATGYIAGPFAGYLNGEPTTYAYVAPKQQVMGPLNFTMNGSADEAYLRTDDKTRTKLNNQANLNQSYVISRSITITPGANVQSRWQDINDPFTVTLATSTTGQMFAPEVPVVAERGFQELAGASMNTRVRISSPLTLDQTYNVTWRTKSDSFGLDRSQPDGGIDTHKINWILVGRPSQAILWRSFSGYDLRHLEYEDPNTFRQRRVDPWTNELTISPRRSPHELYFSYVLGYFPTRGSSWEMSERYTGIHKTLLTTSLLYSHGTEGVMTWNNTIGVYVSPGWRVDSQLNFYVPTLKSDRTIGQVGKVIDDEFIVERDIHCWTVQFVFRNQPPISQEYSIVASLKFGPEEAKPKQLDDKELETQFYPWRSGAWAN